MKYVAFAEPGGPEVLRVADRPRPDPRPGEVLIEVEAAGVSRADTLQRKGLYPPPPNASPHLGLEVAGTVCAVGSDVGGVRLGERVVALCNGGGYAEFACVPAGHVLPLPETWSFVEGATLPENAFTVFDNLIVRARLQAGDVVLVHGGTSGIGTTAIMFARALGARVIATAGSREKCEATIRIGAEAAIAYREEDFVERVLALTDGRGVDIVLDIVGGEYVARDLRAVAIEGRIACIATAGGTRAEIDLGRLLQRRATIFGSSLRPRSDAEKAQIAGGLRARMWPLLDDRDAIVPLVDSIYTFSDARAAHERLEASAHVGKIVLVPDAPGRDG
ncbi:MAG: NAD(P)H-quinone oxidoreductase [bacterium]|nr:NAD(P)H-quinone oxidoreductase [bacterium]